MIVTFKATLDDFTEATFHSLKLRKRLRPWYRRLSTYALLLVGLGVGRFLSPSEPLKLAFGFGIALILMGCDEFLYRKLIYRRSRDFHLKQLGIKLPLEYKVKLSEFGLKLVEGERETDVPWTEIESLEEISKRIFINERNGSVTVIPFSAFLIKSEKDNFLKTFHFFLTRSKP